ISYPTAAQCLLDCKSAASLVVTVVTAATSALPTVVPPPVTLLVTAHPLETCGFFGSVCGFTGVSLDSLVEHPTLPKSTPMFRISSSPDLVTIYSHRHSPTLTSCITGLFATAYTPDIEAAPSRQGFYGAKLHRLNLLLLVTARFTVQECGYTKFTRYYFTAASPSHYAVSSIDGSSHNRLCGSPIHFLLTGTTVQELLDVLLKPYLYSSSLHWRVETLVHQSQDLMSAEALTKSYRLLHMTPLPPLFRVRLVSPSYHLYVARSSSLQATTIAPQAAVTTSIFRLERFSTFSGELLESSPRLPQVPVLLRMLPNSNGLRLT
ncbi:hypothetical protein HID58_033850, partial [Brassica napus]